MNLSKEVRNIEDTYERINFLKDKFKGKTAYLITCGPSLTKLDHATLNKKLKQRHENKKIQCYWDNVRYFM